MPKRVTKEESFELISIADTLPEEEKHQRIPPERTLGDTQSSSTPLVRTTSNAESSTVHEEEDHARVNRASSERTSGALVRDTDGWLKFVFRIFLNTTTGFFIQGFQGAMQNFQVVLIISALLVVSLSSLVTWRAVSGVYPLSPHSHFRLNTPEDYRRVMVFEEEQHQKRIERYREALLEARAALRLVRAGLEEVASFPIDDSATGSPLSRKHSDKKQCEADACNSTKTKKAAPVSSDDGQTSTTGNS